MSRAALAAKLGVNQFSLANVERAVAPVRFFVGYNFCVVFSLSLRWLATGQLPRNTVVPAPPEITRSIGRNMLFSKAYDERLRVFVESELGTIAMTEGKEVKDLDQIIIVSNGRVGDRSLAADHFERTIDFVKDWAVGMTEEQKITFANQLGDVCCRFFNQRGGGRVATVGTVGKEIQLTDAATSSSVAPVKPQLPSLLERLARATAKPGKKSELSKFLSKVTKAKVPLASVSRWLSGEREPGGEIALLLDYWATAQGFPRGR